jgi:hypothetical protein
VDQLLEDATSVEEVYEAQGKRHPKSQSRGRAQTPAEVVLRLLILNIFEPHTEIIRKGKASKPNEFGKLEAENQIITHYGVFAGRPDDSDPLVPRSRTTSAAVWAATTNGCR